jgi:hypothetical protein
LKHLLSFGAAAVTISAAALLAACASPRFDGPDGDRLFYEARCGVCHVAYPRESHDVDDWPAILDDMAPRAGLGRSQKARVLRYVMAAEIAPAATR